jgi:hypothetical protein
MVRDVQHAAAKTRRASCNVRRQARKPFRRVYALSKVASGCKSVGLELVLRSGGLCASSAKGEPLAKKSAHKLLRFPYENLWWNMRALCIFGRRAGSTVGEGFASGKSVLPKPNRRPKTALGGLVKPDDECLVCLWMAEIHNC